jgi:L-arabinose isomerase
VEGKKPRLGLVFFVARWFEEVVLGNDDSAREFDRFMEEDTDRIVKGLSHGCELVRSPMVSSTEKAREAANLLLNEDVDAVLLCFVVWAEDEYILPFKDLMRIRPTILWVYTPYERAPEKTDIMTLFRNSGIVSCFQEFGVLKGMGLKPFFVFGNVSDGESFGRIKKIAHAAQVRRRLQTVRLAGLPYRNDQMIVTYVDEFRLYAQIGPRVDYISVLELKKAADAVGESEVKRYVEQIKSGFRIDGRITDENLHRSAQASLGLERIMNERDIDGLALSDLNPELHEVMGLRPCLYPESLASSSRVVGNEGDLGGTTAMVMLHLLTGLPVMFTEIFNFDRKDNTIVAGHAGPANYLLADRTGDVSITVDYELIDAASDISGVWMEFISEPGRVTIINFICTPEGFQMTILGGESLGGKLRVVGYPHYYIRIDPDMDDFIRSNAEHGVSHHWAVVQGDVRDEMAQLADMLRVKKVELKESRSDR